MRMIGSPVALAALVTGAALASGAPPAVPGAPDRRPGGSHEPVPAPGPAADWMAALPTPVTNADYYDHGEPDPAKVELGRALFFDPILSGNRNISCATCHHPRLATTDGLPLGIGEGPRGLGRDRRPGSSASDAVHARIPRNSPSLFNLGAKEFTTLFHDGRVEPDTAGYFEGGFITPAKWKLPAGLENPLAAQAMFPVTSPDEMAGQRGENPLAEARSLNNVAGPGGVWEKIASRLAEIPEYVVRFQAAFPDHVGDADDIQVVHAANAIAAFEAVAFRSDESPFDRFLRGEPTMTAAQLRGAELFYGDAGCSSCHAGAFQTDHGFHAIAMPQIGPGKGDGSHARYWSVSGEKAFLEDFGRGRVTVRPEDRFKFRTPSLRNVELTGPWGHAGAYDDLEAVVRHHLDPVASLEAYVLPDDYLTPLESVYEVTMTGSRLGRGPLSGPRLRGYLQRDGWVQADAELRGRIAAANELEPRPLADAQVADLLAFLRSLTDPSARRLAEVIPDRVPSGLPVER